MADSSLIQRLRRRPLESYNTTVLGFIALVAIAALVSASLIVKLLGIGYTHYTAEFLQAAALQPGNIITVAGIEVGTVESMKLVGDHVEVGLKVRNNIPMGKDTKASIQIQTILGGRYMALMPDGPGSLPDKTISLDHTEVPYDLQTLLDDGAHTFDQVDSDQIGESIAVLSKQVDGLPATIPQLMENIHRVSTTIADRRDQLGTLLKSTQRVAGTLRRQQTNVGNLINQGQDLIGEFVAHQATFHAMLRGLTDLASNLDKIVVNDRPMLDDMLKNIRELTDMLGQHDDLFRNVLQAGPVGLRGVANATGYGPALEFFLPNGIAIDSWMCAISGRAKQFDMIEYFKDCK